MTRVSQVLSEAELRSLVNTKLPKPQDTSRQILTLEQAEERRKDAVAKYNENPTYGNHERICICELIIDRIKRRKPIA